MNVNNSMILGIVGGGPAALLLLKNMVENSINLERIYIFEKNDRMGVGMPYGKDGSSVEHVANVSANELPNFEISFEDYIESHPPESFADFLPRNFNPYKVIPRLLLGNYLEFVFKFYIRKAKKQGTGVIFHTNCEVRDIVKNNSDNSYSIITSKENVNVHFAVLCTGHYWPKTYEGLVEGWFDSPYPPSKFTSPSNHTVAVRGSSLTAVDAVKTLARLNGTFIRLENGNLKYKLNDTSQNFKIEMFSTGGFLPALRFHSEDQAYSGKWIMSLDEIYEYKQNHGGFIDLDYVYDKSFKKPLKNRDPEFFETIKDLSLEAFVEKMIGIRRELDSFTLFQAEYKEAERSIHRKQSISWKECLAAFSYAMNYPAKHFSAEDMIRLRKTMMPLISVIIASLPQSSYEELIALYEADILDLTQVDKESYVEPHSKVGAVYHYKSVDDKKIEQHYPLFIDAVGQQPLEVKDIPFPGLQKDNLVSAAYLNFKNNDEAARLINADIQIHKGFNNNYYMNVHGVEINDHFQSLDPFGAIVKGLYIMAVPFIGGLNPDYSGLDFCDTAGKRVALSIGEELSDETSEEKEIV